ncbi:MAG: GDP-mannose 4,6-dehydratase [Betaproteobacteria bacterium]
MNSVAAARAPARALLVTGLQGFVGQHLRRALGQPSAPGWTVAGPLAEFDLLDPGATAVAIAAAQPDAVIHLAAQTAVPDSYRDPEATFTVNVFGTLRLLTALAAQGFRGRFLYVGSADVYGLVPESRLPIDEHELPRPRNPYAVSKLAAEALCWQWHVSNGIEVILARPFNHIGPGQSDRFVVSDFARQIIAIKHGQQSPCIRVGDLDTTRDFTDVRDVVGAYLALLERGVAGEIYNVCSGVERTIRSILEELLSLAGVKVAIERDSTRMRQSEQRRVRGDPGKLYAATGWLPHVSITESLKDVLAYWEERIGHG